MRRFYEPLQDQAGNIIAGAEVFFRENTGEFDLITLYSDDGSTETANPVVSGSDGYIDCWFDDGTYKIEVYVDGELERTISDYQHFDLDNITAFAWTLLGDATAADARETLGITIGARTITGTANEVTVTNGDGVAGNPTISLPTPLKTHTITLLVTDPNGSAITTGDGKAYYRVPSTLNGCDLVSVAGAVTTVSSSGIPTVQIANVTQAVDMLTTKLTIDANETDSSTAAAAAVIDTANDDVATADLLRIDVDVAGTGAKGLIVELQFRLP